MLMMMRKGSVTWGEVRWVREVTEWSEWWWWWWWWWWRRISDVSEWGEWCGVSEENDVKGGLAPKRASPSQGKHPRIQNRLLPNRHCPWEAKMTHSHYKFNRNKKVKMSMKECRAKFLSNPPFNTFKKSSFLSAPLATPDHTKKQKCNQIRGIYLQIKKWKQQNDNKTNFPPRSKVRQVLGPPF